MKLVYVLGAGGFIGGHVVRTLIDNGIVLDSVRHRDFRMIAVDKKPLAQWWQTFDHPDGLSMVDDWDIAEQGVPLWTGEILAVIDLAADMGGMGYIIGHELQTMMNVKIAVRTVEFCKQNDVQHALFASSACVYPYVDGPLHESLAYTGMPEPGYGEEKLFSERLFNVAGYSTVRFHNVYGPHGSWCDGREKAPAAICRKVAEAKRDGRNYVKVWGTGDALRTYLYVEDAVRLTLGVLGHRSFKGPVNVGSTELISVDGLVRLVSDIAGHSVGIHHEPGPVGAPSRCSQNDLLITHLGDYPRWSLRDGLTETYQWIEQQVNNAKT